MGKEEEEEEEGGLSTQTRIEIISNAIAGIWAARWPLTQHTHTHTATCCLKDLLDACRDMSHSIHITVPQHTQTNTLCSLSSALAGILTFP